MPNKMVPMKIVVGNGLSIAAIQIITIIIHIYKYIGIFSEPDKNEFNKINSVHANMRIIAIDIF